ncbi:hypothetical protein DV20_24460 [Amycolatopsis rifamycinica]|uniref:DUF3558 domain-containing protein n=1 Tax=Amycolatopsis rifamycinica TaxID=287986 RepID=A0A066TXC0_9PSEU|nr:hypothetical protein DV20_24460 [Amycolatopsis rifamycinica]
MFRSKLGVLVILVTVSAGLAAACTTTTGGTASPSTAGSSSATGSPSADPEVPKVSAPLDASKYVADTCALVPKDVLASLGMPETGTFQPKGDTLFTKAGPNCAWKIRGQGTGVLVSLGTGSRDAGSGGLAGLYAAYRAKTLIRFLEHAPDVDGYPAVYWGPLDERRMGSCGIGVGIADDLTFDVYAQGYQGADDSCGAANQVAASVIKTLKGA